jgi:hypothetical protein
MMKIAVAMMITIALSGTVRAAEPITPPSVPADIVVPAGFKPFFWGHAVGTQNFICVQVGAGLDWVFIGPQATLFDSSSLQIVTHFQSKNPFQSNEIHATWQHSRDTSVTWAKKLYGSTDAAYVAPGAIEWLLLEVTGGDVGPLGGNKLATTRFIHRVNTAGGLKPPTAECTAAIINTRRLVPYEADYYFYR